jgi:hypothetical protein
MRFVRAALVGLFAIAGLAPAHAVDRFDGAWAVYIYGEPGPCAFGYRLPIDIKGTDLFYKGKTVNPYAIGLNPSGTVTIRLDGGSYIVTGSGALGGKGSGGGTWKAPALRCEGKWKAERQ